MESKDFYQALLEKAKDEIGKHGAIMVSGTVNVHNEDQRESNIARITRVIQQLRETGWTVFDSMQYLDIRLTKAPCDYATKFEIFWKGLIQSGRIKMLFVLQSDRNTKGVQSEIRYAQDVGIPIEFING